jgi:hypothetical protein
MEIGGFKYRAIKYFVFECVLEVLWFLFAISHWGKAPKGYNIRSLEVLAMVGDINSVFKH